MLQPWFVELITIISEIIVGISAIAVAVFAFIGLRQWKIQLTGRTKFEVARKMAILAFEFRDEYKRVRSPMTLPGESSERQVAESETLEETNLLNEYFARRNRLRPLQDTLRKLYETSWEAEIILDKDIGKFIKPLEKAFSELYASIESYFGAEHSRINRQVPTGRKEDWLENHFNRIYGHDHDDIAIAIDASIQSLVDKLKTYL
jgi:hypothetical protein